MGGDGQTQQRNMEGKSRQARRSPIPALGSLEGVLDIARKLHLSGSDTRCRDTRTTGTRKPNGILRHPRPIPREIGRKSKGARSCGIDRTAVRRSAGSRVTVAVHAPDPRRCVPSGHVKADAFTGKTPEPRPTGRTDLGQSPAACAGDTCRPTTFAPTDHAMHGRRNGPIAPTTGICCDTRTDLVPVLYRRTEAESGRMEDLPGREINRRMTRCPSRDRHCQRLFVWGWPSRGRPAFWRVASSAGSPGAVLLAARRQHRDSQEDTRCCGGASVSERQRGAGRRECRGCPHATRKSPQNTVCNSGTRE